jgi:hypothetical protein
MKPNDFLPEFLEALEADLNRGNEKWGDTWLKRNRQGQEARIKQWCLDQFDKFENVGTPIRWQSFAGEALIAWIRENHPEIFPK